MRRLHVLLALPLSLLVACGETDSSGEAPDGMVTNGGEAVPGEVWQPGDARTVDLPAGVPQPERYAMLSDVSAAGMRIVSLEVGEDLRSLTERFNRALSAGGMPHEALRDQTGADGSYVAMGRVDTPVGRIRGLICMKSSAVPRMSSERSATGVPPSVSRDSCAASVPASRTSST
jgi:hypothetical protein